jgi:hypothetical protein
VCGARSWNPNDVKFGYCGRCHEFTGTKGAADWSTDPEAREWIEGVRTGLVPKLEESALTISLVPEGNQTDVKFAVELGMSIMMEKPIMLVIAPGQRVPPALVKIADEIVEVDWRADPKLGQERMAEAIGRMSALLGPAEAS